MGTKIVGKLDWSEGDVSDGGGGSFMKFKEGSNEVRVVTSPYQFYKHWTKDATGADRNVRCALDGCPLCQQGEQAQARWYIGVIDRATGKPTLAEIGSQIFKQIYALTQKKQWGNIKTYDIDITRAPKGSQPLYIVSPLPKSPIAEEEKVMCKEFFDKVDFNKLTAPSTPDEIMEKLGMAKPKPVAPKSEVSDSFEEPAAETTDNSDDDFNFDA